MRVPKTLTMTRKYKQNQLKPKTREKRKRDKKTRNKRKTTRGRENRELHRLSALIESPVCMELPCWCPFEGHKN